MKTRYSLVLATLAILALLVVIAWNQARLHSKLNALELALDEAETQRSEVLSAAQKRAPVVTRAPAGPIDAEDPLSPASSAPALSEEQLAGLAEEISTLREAIEGLQGQAESIAIAGPLNPMSSVPAEFIAISEAAQAKGRNWGSEQAVGAPDTPLTGDLPTAIPEYQRELYERARDMERDGNFDRP